MIRVRVALCSLLTVSCTLNTKSQCPDEYTPNDPACAWRYCQDHDDPRCVDGGGIADASLPELDAGADATSAPDASEDASADAGCRTASDCPSTQPYCLPSGACAACMTDAQCPLESPSCVSGACTPCASSSACTRFSATAVCDPTSGSCVACTPAEPAACTATDTVCKTAGTTCVACNTNAECPSAEASRCQDNTCAACTGDTDCAHVTGTPVCNAGTCVACTPATEAERCGETACDPDTLTCTTTKRGSLGTCLPCRADSECLEGRKCVPVPFMGAESGYYCMQSFSSGCANPYRSTPLTAVSRSGSDAMESMQYCSHNTDVTSCDAIVALASDKACSLGTVEGDCGKGARCEAVNGPANRCTYACGSDAVCPGDFPCNEQSSNTPYCGGPGQ